MSEREYGFWASPLLPERLAAGGVRLGFPSFAGDVLYFIEQRAAEQGRGVLMSRTAAGAVHEVLPSTFSVRTRVHEYGGLAYRVLPGAITFVNQADQQLWISRAGQAPVPLTAASDTRFAEPVHDPGRSRLIAVAERHAPDGVQNSLVAVSLRDADLGAVTVLASGRDFYAAPALSPDGAQLAFLAWDHPHMPWDAAELQLAQLGAAGEVASRVHAGGSAGASAFQPSWSPDGVLYVALERAGYWNLHRWSNGELACVAEQAAELGAPLWQLGTRLFEFDGRGNVIGACFAQGLSRVVRIELASGAVSTISDELGHVGQLALAGDELVCLVGWAGGGSELVRFRLPNGRRESVHSAYAGWLSEADSARPEAFSFPTSGGETAYGIFYAPCNTRAHAPAGRLPPLIVLVHGGPTACTAPVWKPEIQFWTTRGFAVFDVNYRGSSGFGRAYRDRLRGGWGVLDVDDCVYGAQQLAASGKVDARALFIRGGSAGGYTVLQALVNHDVFAAGSCHYGISDLEALVRETHKFESHYDRFLIGPYPERRDLFLERSPIYSADRIRKPVVFFQGLDDKVVPANQTERMALTLRDRGVPCAYHAYPGEQHGFRRAETIRHVLETELEFFQRLLEQMRLS